MKTVMSSSVCQSELNVLAILVVGLFEISAESKQRPNVGASRPSLPERL